MTTIDAGTPEASDVGFLEWLHLHEVDPQWTWRVEYDEQKMVVHQYEHEGQTLRTEEDERGNLQPVVAAPFEVRIKEPLW